MTLHNTVEPCYTGHMTENGSKILDRLRKNRDKRDALLTERDALILEAKRAGVAVTHIADAIGLDRTQVHRIIRTEMDRPALEYAKARREAMTEEERAAEDAEHAALHKRVFDNKN